MNKRGVSIAAPPLISVLQQLGEHSEAAEVLKQALVIAPRDRTLLRLSQEPVASKEGGRIKVIIQKAGRTRFGFIIPDGGGKDIYFSERRLGAKIFDEIAKDAIVEVKVIETPRGKEAISIEIYCG